MKIFYLKKFIKQYKKLPSDIKNQAEEREIIFREDPYDTRLKTHKLHGNFREFYAFFVSSKIRIIFDFNKDGNARFYTIGNHDIYY